MKEILQGKWLGHPIHPAIVHLPTGLWPASLVLDVLSYFGGGENALVRIAFFFILIGFLAAVVAVPFGLADWWDLKKDKPAWAIGVYHMVLNLLGASIWALNLGLRAGSYEQVEKVTGLQLSLSLLGVMILFVSGYLGGRMVYGFGVSVARLTKDKWRRIAEAGGSPAAREKEA